MFNIIKNFFYYKYIYIYYKIKKIKNIKNYKILRRGQLPCPGGKDRVAATANNLKAKDFTLKSQ